LKLATLGIALTVLRPAAAAPAPAAAPGVSLIYCGWFGSTIPTPAFIRNNKAFLETQPFHGLVAYLRDDATGLNATTRVMTGTAISQASIASILAPLQGQSWVNLKKNFGLVQGSSPPDVFDDWSVTIQNFANCAAALKDAGLAGICFDNEQYFSPWGDYPSGAKYYETKTLNDYRAQMRLRGKQVMEAMVAVFPDIAVITLHGPSVSEPNAPSSLGFPQWQSGNELLGPYYAGFMEGVGTSSALNIDGGELYDLRTPTQFLNTYNWRKYDEASDAVNSPFIPASLRPVWSSRISISYGVYDKPFNGAAMDSTILKSTLINALAQADHYVWFYTEGPTFLRPSSAGRRSCYVGNAVLAEASALRPPRFRPRRPPACCRPEVEAPDRRLLDEARRACLTGLQSWTRKTATGGRREPDLPGRGRRSAPIPTTTESANHDVLLPACSGRRTAAPTHVVLQQANATTTGATPGPPGPTLDPTPDPTSGSDPRRPNPLRSRPPRRPSGKSKRQRRRLVGLLGIRAGGGPRAAAAAVRRKLERFAGSQ
jgi:hypothetical protein